MPYHAGLLHYEIGRHLPDSTARQVHLQQAQSTFTRLHAEPDRQRVIAALAQSGKDAKV